MRNTLKTGWSAVKVAGRWDTHPSSVLRIMKRFGYSGAKFGTAKQAARRFPEREVRIVEKLAGFNHE